MDIGLTPRPGALEHTGPLLAELETRALIARSSAGDCCVLCGRVGIDLPADHGCVPNVSPVEVARPPYSWAQFWEQKERRHQPAPTRASQGSPTAAGLGGLLRRMAAAEEGERNSVLYWAGCRLAEHGYGPAAADALTAVARQTGLSDQEIRRTLRSAGVAA